MVAGDPASTITDALERLGQLQRVLLQEVSTAEGLSPIQVRILGLGATAAVRPSELASRLGVTRATVTDAVRALESKGLVAVAPDPRDGRCRLLKVTAAGHAVAGRVASWGTPVTRHLAALPSGDQGSVLAGLLRLLAGLQADGLVPRARMCLTCRFFRPHAGSGVSTGSGVSPGSGVSAGVAAPALPASTGSATPRGVAHCALVGADLPDTALRLDCPEHQAAG